MFLSTFARTLWTEASLSQGFYPHRTTQHRKKGTNISPRALFEPTISQSKLPNATPPDRAATLSGTNCIPNIINKNSLYIFNQNFICPPPPPIVIIYGLQVFADKISFSSYPIDDLRPDSCITVWAKSWLLTYFPAHSAMSVLRWRNSVLS